MEIKEMIVSGKSLSAVKRGRSRLFVYESIHPKMQKQYEESGWAFDKKLKNRIRMKKQKSVDIRFEDDVWITFANLGFNKLNRDRQFKIQYDDLLTQQIDVFAADDETIILIECKATDELKKGNFKECIDAIGGRKEGIIKEIRKSFPEKKFKIKFAFATRNYIISNNDHERLKKYDIQHFDDDAIQYYTDLGKHLGHSARFQLLGNVFEGQKIPEIENVIPAIEGTMGGYKYYSFSIEPEKLLKIGYVLHRNKANRRLMPTYQRLIKKSRLTAIQNYVNNGGFFPNSIIINIVTNGNNLKFDLSGLQSEDSLSRIGLLHLPQKYRSAYIIDGQHRLYGYAESKYKNKNTIPVVAFIDLDKSEQIKLFMDINENQKAVSKNLRNTLNSELLWDSPDQNAKRKALRLQIARDLGEEKTSPLYNRVIVGENRKTQEGCITIDTIQNSLSACNFLSQFKANAITKDGTFDRGNNDATFDTLFEFIVQCLNYIRSGLEEEWNKGEADNGYITINAGIFSIIRILNDITDHLIKSAKLMPKLQGIEYMVEEMKYYMDPLIMYLNMLTPEQKEALRKSYGIGGRTKYWRILQRAIAEVRPDFNPDGMQQYWRDNSKFFNEESFKIIRDIECYIKDDFRSKLEKKYGGEWFTVGLPKTVYDSANKLASDKNYENISSGKKYSPWDCLTLINYRDIATYGSNWQDLFEKEYTRPDERKVSGGKSRKTEWLEKLSKIRNQNAHAYSVSEQEYEFLKELHDWLFDNKNIS